MTMRKALLGFLTLLLSAGAQAQWKVIDGVAAVENKEGHALSVYRQANGTVWAQLTLSNRTPDEFAPKKAPVYRVDQNPANDLAHAMLLQDMGGGFQAFAWNPKSVHFLIWQGSELQGRSDKVNHLMTGKAAVFQYEVAGGTLRETTFPLNGAGQAIARALDIPKKDRTLVEDPEAFRWAYAASLKKCQRDLGNPSECSSRAIACAKRAKSANLPVFRACME